MEGVKSLPNNPDMYKGKPFFEGFPFFIFSLE